MQTCPPKTTQSVDTSDPSGTWDLGRWVDALGTLGALAPLGTLGRLGHFESLGPFGPLLSLGTLAPDTWDGTLGIYRV